MWGPLTRSEKMGLGRCLSMTSSASSPQRCKRQQEEIFRAIFRNMTGYIVTARNRVQDHQHPHREPSHRTRDWSFFSPLLCFRGVPSSVLGESPVCFRGVPRGEPAVCRLLSPRPLQRGADRERRRQEHQHRSPRSSAPHPFLSQKDWGRKPGTVTS